MHRFLSTLAITAAALVGGSIPAFAQEAALQTGPTEAPSPSIKVNPANWLFINTKDGENYVHKASGAICVGNFRDLKLTAIRDYAPDGSNIGCQYDKAGEQGPSRLTVYVYTAEGLTGPKAYQGAKDAIAQLGQTTATTIIERKEEGQKCHQAVMRPLAQALLGRMKEEGAEGEEAQLGLGLALYDYDIPKINGRPAAAQTSMLSVYQTGKWIVKTRTTLPKSETSYGDACNYGGLASVALARVITRKDGPALVGSQ